MDLSKLWEGAGDHDEGGGVEDGQRRDKRQYTYKRKGITFSSTTKDNRTLRSMQVTERRKGSRQSMHSAGRVFDGEDLATAVENDENDSVETKLKSSDDIKIKSRIRREKLNEYLEQKKKLEDMKRKMAKPAFKVGIVHHPVAPTSGADVAPNRFSTTLKTANAVPRHDRDKSMSSNKIRRTKSDLTGERSKAFVFSAKDIIRDISTKLPSVVEDQNINKSLTKKNSSQTKILAGDILKDLSLHNLVTVSKMEEKLPDVETHDSNLTTITEDIHDNVHEVSNTNPDAVTDQLPVLHIQESKENEDSSEIIEPPSVQLDHLALNASCSNKNTMGLSKSKESFIWFVKKATCDNRSHAHTELYHWLLKMFTEADINREGLVRKVSFNKLFDMAVSIPRMYGYAPVESELYKTDEQKDQARQKLLDSMDIRDTGVITFNEWYQFSKKHIFAKTAKLYLHPIIDASDKQQFMGFIKDALVPGSSENTELYRFLVEVFAEHDVDKDGVVTIKEFPAMVNEVLKIPKKVSLVHSAMKQEEDDDDVRSEQHQESLFKTYSTQNRMSLDEWLMLSTRDIYMKL